MILGSLKVNYCLIYRNKASVGRLALVFKKKKLSTFQGNSMSVIPLGVGGKDKAAFL